jgi:tetratricopeptide (TPR) repeat protein
MLRRQNRLDEAASVLQDALRADPTSPEANVAYADLLVLRDETNDAIAHYATAIEFGDRRGETYLRLADALMRQEVFAEAIRHYRLALARIEADAETLSRIAWLMATCPKAELRDCQTAIELASRACKLTRYEHPVAMDTLAAGYAECGQWDAAVSWARRAIDVAGAAGDAAVVESIGARLTQYEARRDIPRRGDSSLLPVEKRPDGN